MARPTDKKFYLKTFGCQMNVYDSERMIEALAGDGYRPTDELDAADLVILNTCHIREKAAEKVYSDLGRIRQVKEAREAGGKRTVIAVTGCVAQAEGAEISVRQPAVDLVVGPQSYHRLPGLVRDAEAAQQARLVETEFAGEDKFAQLTSPRKTVGPSAFLAVQEGCDKFCTFCVVPYTRGAEYSRPVADIEAEARALVDAGAAEIVLLGQNVNAYHGACRDGRSASLADLMRQLSKIEGLARIRYTTSHPRDMTADLIAAHAELPKLMPYLHLPVQSGSDRVLAAMNRKHTAAEYLDVIGKVRAARPDIAISGDFIVGFPGESERDFEATLEIVRAVSYAQAYSFKYSVRPGTPAAGHADQVPDEVKAERLERLQATLDRGQAAFNERSVGTVVPVLFERTGRSRGVLVGRTPHLQLVHAEAPAKLIGQIWHVALTVARRTSLDGVVAAA